MKRFYVFFSIIFFTYIPLFIHASGVSDETFSIWYHDILGNLGDENIEDTGLTVFPTLLVPMGGEYEAMGTAYSAVARDASYIEANPAASTDIKSTEIALFHNNLIADTNLESVVYTTRFEKLGIGIGAKYLHVPFTEYDSQGVQSATARYSETVLIANTSYNFFNNSAFYGVSTGANIKIAYRNIPEIIAPNQSAFALMTDIGALHRFNMLKPYYSKDYNSAVSLVVRNVGLNILKAEEPLPTTLSVGTAYSLFRPWILAADITLPFYSIKWGNLLTYEYAMGTAVSITEFFSLRSGVHMLGGNPRFNMGGSVLINKIKLTTNYTIDLTTQFNNVDKFSIEISAFLGDKGRAARARKVNELYIAAINALSEDKTLEAIQLAEQALKLDPNFVPARETIELAKDVLRFQTSIDEIYSDYDHAERSRSIRESLEKTQENNSSTETDSTTN